MSLSETISARTHRFMETTLGTDTARAQDHLSSRRVRIALDPLVAGDYTGQMILFTLLNLLVRLDAYCPALEVVVPEVARHPLVRLLPPGALGTSLFTFFSSFPAARRLSIRSTEPVRSSGTDISLGISPRPTPGAVSIWADGWIVYLNAPAPTGAADLNPVGASVAAGLGAAELFKRLVLELPLRPGLRVLPIEHLIFSTYDYRLEAGENPPLPSVIDVDGVVVVVIEQAARAEVRLRLPALRAFRG